MTVKELKTAINDLPNDMDVMIVQERDEEGLYSMAETAKVRSVTFQDQDIPEEEWADLDCLVITD